MGVKVTYTEDGENIMWRTYPEATGFGPDESTMTLFIYQKRKSEDTIADVVAVYHPALWLYAEAEE